mgnify:CR=1 FL=1
MIKGWSKFNERSVWFDTKDRLISENKPTIIKVINDVRDCFSDFEDDSLITKYAFGGMYNPKKNKDIDSNTNHSPRMNNRSFYPQPSELDLDRISEFFVPEYSAKFLDSFMYIGINFKYKEGGWISDEGIDSLDYLIEAKNRLKSRGYRMEICFWATKFTKSQIEHMSHIEPLEVRVYFDLDCEWPQLSEIDLA